jgi:DNA-nicking Smr family endonuclease
VVACRNERSTGARNLRLGDGCRARRTGRRGGPLMRGRTREPTPLELALWHEAVRTVVRRSERSAPAPPPEPPAPGAPPSAAPAGGEAAAGAAATGHPAATATPRSRPRPSASPSPTPLDRRTLRRLERGQFPISARLDLHGLDQRAAHDTLLAFLARARDRSHRCVLVITGRGERSGGVLRQSVPRWLEEPPLAALVLGWAEAGRAHGGAGALYLLLRRRPADRLATPGAPARARRR